MCWINLQHMPRWPSVASGTHAADARGQRRAALRSSVARRDRCSARRDALALRGGQEQARVVQRRRRGGRFCSPSKRSESKGRYV